MKNQILKAIKGLKRFTIEDIELITGFDEAEILEILKQLPVRNSGNIYFFETPVPTPVKRKSGIDFGKIIDLIPIERGYSGRIIKLKIIGSNKSLIIQFR